MELIISIKGNKYFVKDKKDRLQYTVKKKGFGSKYILYNASDYNLYTLVQTGDDRKPSYAIVLNDATFMTFVCKSLFLDPTLVGQGKDANYSLASKDRKHFSILLEGNEVGTIDTSVTVGGELQYDLAIEDKLFDDYIPLFAVMLDKSFGAMNKPN
ncbi:MAG: hypothetical protein IKQ90_09300 [Ruminococcus sp.]|nr:hypothetical protein [Ruminococcus sp.]